MSYTGVVVSSTCSSSATYIYLYLTRGKKYGSSYGGEGYQKTFPLSDVLHVAVTKQSQVQFINKPAEKALVRLLSILPYSTG